MIARRSLITAMLGVVGAGASGVRVSDAVKAADLGASVPDVTDLSEFQPVAVDDLSDAPWYSASQKLRELVRDEEAKLESAIYRGLPADIAAMRSWSGVVKQDKAYKRLQKLRAVRRALNEEHSAVSLMRKLGLPV